MNKIIVGNWKLYPTLSDSLILTSHLKKTLTDIKGVEIVLTPPLAWLLSVVESWGHRTEHIHFAAQNVWPEDQGAFTGETSAYMLKDVVEYALVGHSERRRYGQENNALIAQKLQACLKWQIKPILCVGEDHQAIENGKMSSYEWEKLTDQLLTAFEGVSKERAESVIVAYEPVWAIGTGKSASAQYAEEMIVKLREKLAEHYDLATAERIHFIYGGSVSAENAAEYLRRKEIDGLLPGSISVKAKDFVEICQIASKLKG